MANATIYTRLPHIFAVALTVSEILIFFTFEKSVKVTECNCRNDNVWWKMSKSTNDSQTFSRSAHRFRHSKILNLLPSKVGQGYTIQFSHWQRLMRSVKICKRLTNIFELAPFRFRNVKIFNFYFKKVGQGRRDQFSYWHHSIANVKFNNGLLHIFLRELSPFQIY